MSTSEVSLGPRAVCVTSNLALRKTLRRTLNAGGSSVEFLDELPGSQGSSAAIVGSTVPISGLGTFGALEGGWTAGFVAVGVESATAASTAIIMSGLTLLFAVILGAIGWVALGMVRPAEET